jgi:hypothetical protein
MKFLDVQLESCDKSIFCDHKLVGDILTGMKGFVVDFMIRMSKVNSISFVHASSN